MLVSYTSSDWVGAGIREEEVETVDLDEALQVAVAPLLDLHYPFLRQIVLDFPVCRFVGVNSLCGCAD